MLQTTSSIWDVLTAFGSIGAAVAARTAATAALRQASFTARSLRTTEEQMSRHNDLTERSLNTTIANLEKQNERASRQPETNLLMKLEDNFDTSRRYLNARNAAARTAAEDLRQNRDVGKVRHCPPAAGDVLFNFFERLAHLVDRVGMNRKAVWNTLGWWIEGYWATYGPWIEQRRQEYGETYCEDFQRLSNRMAEISRKHLEQKSSSAQTGCSISTNGSADYRSWIGRA